LFIDIFALVEIAAIGYENMNLANGQSATATDIFFVYFEKSRRAAIRALIVTYFGG